MQRRVFWDGVGREIVGGEDDKGIRTEVEGGFSSGGDEGEGGVGAVVVYNCGGGGREQRRGEGATKENCEFF